MISKYFSIYSIIFLGLIARTIITIFYADIGIDNEWRVMLINLYENGILSIRSVNGSPVPNLFMPPLYPIFLYGLKLVFLKNEIFMISIYTFHILFSLIAVYFFYLTVVLYFNKKLALLGTAIFCFFPLHIYSVSQISSINLQVVCFSLFLYGLTYLLRYKKDLYLTIFSITSGLLILLRGEFFIFYFFSVLFIYLKYKNFKKIILSIIVCLLVVSPYLIRNYKIFNVITITKSGGYNLLKGNNPKSLVEGKAMMGSVREVVPEVKEKLDAIPFGEKYDLYFDQILLNQAILFIKEDPIRYINLFLKKFVAFLIIDFNSTYPNYYSIFHIIPKLILGLATLISISLFFRFKGGIYDYLVYFYFMNIGLFSIFFILPRYSLPLLPIQIMISLCLLKKYFNTNKKSDINLNI